MCYTINWALRPLQIYSKILGTFPFRIKKNYPYCKTETTIISTADKILYFVHIVLYTIIYVNCIIFFVQNNIFTVSVLDYCTIILHLSLMALHYSDLFFYYCQKNVLNKYFTDLQLYDIQYKDKSYKKLRQSCIYYLLSKLVPQIISLYLDFYSQITLKQILFFISKIVDNSNECLIICLLINLHEKIFALNVNLRKTNKLHEKYLQENLDVFENWYRIFKNTNIIFNYYFLVKTLNTFLHAVYAPYFVMHFIQKQFTKIVALQVFLWGLNILMGFCVILFLCYLIENEAKNTFNAMRSLRHINKQFNNKVITHN